MDQLASSSSQIDAPRAWIVPCLTLLIVGVAIAFYWHTLSEPYNQPDSDAYVMMAQGRMSEVHKPFTNRVLCPTIAGFIARATGWSVDASFFATNFICAAAWVSVGLSWILRRTRSLALAVAIVLTPMTLSYCREIYGSDCMHAALVAVFFLMLARGTWWYAMPLLFLLQLTRESTLLLTCVLVLVSACHGKWKLAGTAILVTLLGIGVVAQVSKQGQGNIHESNTLVYLVGKLPFNFLTNVCGVRMWTNTHAQNDPTYYPDPPLVSIRLPDWVPTGNMRQIGIYKLDPEAPLLCARSMLTILGVMPSVAFLVIVWRRRRIMRDDGLSFVCHLSLVYGMLAFLLGPSLGVGYWRLTAHGWPLAWIAAPELLDRYFNKTNRLMGQLAWLQAVVCWTPMLLEEFGLARVSSNLIATAVALTCYVIAIKTLWRNRVS